MLAAVVALLFANSPSQDWYKAMLGFVPWPDAPLGLALDAKHWINDGLMALFFLMVGIEVKREFLTGELSSRAQAILPIFAAVGGMIVPAVLYTSVNWGEDSIHGWGIPMATDIAFALSILAFLGSRISLGLKAFLAALAIIDDLGAVIIIACFYSGAIQLVWLASAAILLLLLWWIGKRYATPWLYILGGIALWFFVYKSGIHATIAGVLLALIIPTSPGARETSISQDILDAIHPVVAYGIVPIFAFVNSGVNLQSSFGPAITSPVSQGIFVGLVVGKPLGIFGACYLACKLKLAKLPKLVRWRQILGAGILAGIGFTMSLFIAELGLPQGESQALAKTGILLASLLAGVTGFFVLALVADKKNPVVGASKRSASQD